MGEIKKTGDRSARVICDCGFWVHDVTADDAGILSLQSTRVKDEPKADDGDKGKKRFKSIFDPSGS